MRKSPHPGRGHVGTGKVIICISIERVWVVKCNTDSPGHGRSLPGKRSAGAVVSSNKENGSARGSEGPAPSTQPVFSRGFLTRVGYVDEEVLDVTLPVKRHFLKKWQAIFGAVLSLQKN